MKKTFAAVAAIGALLLTSACSNNSESAEAEAEPVVEPQGVTWSYLQTEYDDSLFAGENCSKRVDTSPCLQSKGYAIESFERDLRELAPSKTRSDMLGNIEDFKKYHGKFLDAGCYQTPKKEGFCTLWSSFADDAVTIIRLNVGKESKAATKTGSTSTSPTTSNASADDVFKASLDIYWSGTGRFETSKELAKTTCKTLTNGATVQEIRDTIMPIYNDDAIVDNLISASTKAYCPKFHEN